MDEQTTTSNQKFICLECKNEVTITGEHKVGDIIECEQCGIEYEIVSLDNGEYTLRLLEEEK